MQMKGLMQLVHMHIITSMSNRASTFRCNHHKYRVLEHFLMRIKVRKKNIYLRFVSCPQHGKPFDFEGQFFLPTGFTWLFCSHQRRFRRTDIRHKSDLSFYALTPIIVSEESAEKKTKRENERINKEKKEKVTYSSLCFFIPQGLGWPLSFYNSRWIYLLKSWQKIGILRLYLVWALDGKKQKQMASFIASKLWN